MIQLFSVVFLLLGLSLLILPVLPLGLNFKSTSFSPVFCVGRTRQYNTICWELTFFHFFCFLDDCLGGWSQWMWLVSCWRQGMLTQEPARDPKCNCNI